MNCIFHGFFIHVHKRIIIYGILKALTPYEFYCHVAIAIRWVCSLTHHPYIACKMDKRQLTFIKFLLNSTITLPLNSSGNCCGSLFSSWSQCVANIAVDCKSTWKWLADKWESLLAVRIREWHGVSPLFLSSYVENIFRSSHPIAWHYSQNGNNNLTDNTPLNEYHLCICQLKHKQVKSDI